MGSESYSSVKVYLLLLKEKNAITTWRSRKAAIGDLVIFQKFISLHDDESSLLGSFSSQFLALVVV